MTDSRLTKYYLLCSIRLGEHKHIVSELPDKKLEVLLTKKEVNLYLRKHGNYYVARERIIGGDDTADAHVAARGAVIIY